MVGAVGEQNDAARALSESLTGSVVVDRRSNPSHGYRAVHVIAHLAGRPVEIQVRTSLQHLWAEFSEKLSDLVDSRIKYGLGDAAAVELLKQVSELVSHVERAELVGTVAEIAEHKQDVRKVLELAIRHAADYRRGA